MKRRTTKAAEAVADGRKISAASLTNSSASPPARQTPPVDFSANSDGQPVKVEVSIYEIDTATSRISSTNSGAQSIARKNPQERESAQVATLRIVLEKLGRPALAGLTVTRRNELIQKKARILKLTVPSSKTIQRHLRKMI
jgi:hypothetical protein